MVVVPGLFCEWWWRWNSPYINHFVSADTIVPGYTNPQALNRYSYVLNNPVKLTDPTGHQCVGEEEECEDDDGTPMNGASVPTNDNTSPINDPDWGDNDNTVERAQMVWNALCQSGGWWGSGCPSVQQISAWLLFEEGATLGAGDQTNMARGIRYRFTHFGTTSDSFIVQLSAYTAFFNPDGDGNFDQNDWNALTHPQDDLSGSISITEKVYKNDIKDSDGNYMFWWDEGEVVTDRSKWPGTVGENYFMTKTVTGLTFYFTGIPNMQRCAMNGTNCR
jgi:hypothetical protein